MSYNPFDLGGAFARGYEGGERVGSAIGKRFREGQIKRAARNASDIDRKLYDMGVMDETGTIDPALANTPEVQNLIKERDALFVRAADKAADMDQRGWQGQANLVPSLSRYNTLANQGERAKTGMETFTGAIAGRPRSQPDVAAPTGGEVPTDAVAAAAAAGDTGASIPSRVTATRMPEDPFAPSMAQARQLRRVSQITGRQLIAPEEEDKLRAQAINHFGGEALASVWEPFSKARSAVESLPEGERAAAAQQFVPMTADQQDVFIGNLQNAIAYMPNLKGAVIEQKDGQIWLDPDGGGSAEAYPVNTVEGIDRMRSIMDVYSQGTTGVLPNIRAQQAQAQKDQVARTDKANEFMADALKEMPEMLKATGLSVEALTTGISKLNAAWKPIGTAEFAEDFQSMGVGEDEKLVSVRQSEDGRTLFVSRVAGDKETNSVPRTIYRDDAGNILEGDALKQYTGAGNADLLVGLARGMNDMNEASVASFLNAANQLSTAIAQGRPARISFEPQAARRGATAGTTGGPRDENGFPTANRQNNIGARNLNPLNLKGTDGNFRQFSSIDEGFAAAEAQLMRYYEGKGVAGRPRRTVADIISLWAPPSDNNDTRGYIDMVSKELGVAPNQEINLRDPVIRQALVQAMARKETGWQNPYGSAPDAGSRMAAAVPPRPQTGTGYAGARSVADVGGDAPDESGRALRVTGGNRQTPGATGFWADGGNVVIPPDLLNVLKVK